MKLKCDEIKYLYFEGIVTKYRQYCRVFLVILTEQKIWIDKYYFNKLCYKLSNILPTVKPLIA